MKQIVLGSIFAVLACLLPTGLPAAQAAPPTMTMSAVAPVHMIQTNHNRLRHHHKFAMSAQFWEGGCEEMTGRCIFLNRDAQKVVATGAFGALGVALCAAIPIIGCAIAAALLAAAYELISQRGGICGGGSPTGPYYKPNLEIRYTWIHSAKCVW